MRVDNVYLGWAATLEAVSLPEVPITILKQDGQYRVLSKESSCNFNRDVRLVTNHTCGIRKSIIVDQIIKNIRHYEDDNDQLRQIYAVVFDKYWDAA